MKERIQKIIEESVNTKKLIQYDKLILACEKITNSYKAGGKILVCGNGGSAGDAQHMAGEFVNRFKIERKPIPCLALTTDSSIITSIANDYSYEETFSKQVEAFGQKEDIFIGISTSGKSKNIIKAVEKAKEKGIYTICLLGCEGGKLKDFCDLPIIVSSSNTPRIQEAHILIIHIICEIVEDNLFRKD